MVTKRKPPGKLVQKRLQRIQEWADTFYRYRTEDKKEESGPCPKCGMRDKAILLNLGEGETPEIDWFASMTVYVDCDNCEASYILVYELSDVYLSEVTEAIGGKVLQKGERPMYGLRPDLSAFRKYQNLMKEVVEELIEKATKKHIKPRPHLELVEKEREEEVK
jgi:hypothetical protein